MRVTMQDIAVHCGCAKATVSMALRDHPRIATATRARIQAAARALGYRPDPGLSRIARERWRSRRIETGLALAFVSAGGRIERSGSARMLRAVDARARELGYRVQPWQLRDFPDAAALAEQLLLRGQRGLLLSQLVDPGDMAGFPWAEFCAVACGMGHVLPAVHVVKADPFRAMHLAWEQALAAGHRRIGVVISHAPLSWNEEHGLGLALVRQRSLPRGHGRIPPICLQGAEDQRLGPWLERHRPTVLLASGDVSPQRLAQCGWPVPERLQLICTNKPSRSGSISGIDMNFRAIGVAAMDLLAQELAAHRYGLPETQRIVQIAPRWVAGATVRTACQAGDCRS